MFSRIRRRATYANVAMTLALVFAMTGGAYAAKKYLITSTKQISPSVLKALVGKAGAAGAQGPAGPQGAPGAAGAKGDPGAEGKTGSEGKTGPQGATGAKGAAGATGPKGATGEPWAAGGTLPVGKTETGNWIVFETGLETGEVPYVAISFPIPLATPSTKVVYLNFEETEESVGAPKEGCKLQLEEQSATPVAPEHTLCVFTRFEGPGKVTSINYGGALGDSPTGTFLWMKAAGSGILAKYGTWAVTG